MAEHYVIRECQGKVLKRSRFFGESVRWVHDEKRFGAWYIGPFPDRDSALLYSLPSHRRDRAVPVTDLDPVLVEVLREERRCPRPDREIYLDPGSLADPSKLLAFYRELREEREADLTRRALNE